MFQMDRQDGKYFTIWYGVYNRPRRTLAYCNAGHPPALLLSDGTFHQLEADAPAVGMMPEMPYESRTVVGRGTARGCSCSATASSRSRPRTARCGRSRTSSTRMKAELAADGDLIERHLQLHPRTDAAGTRSPTTFP